MERYIVPITETHLKTSALMKDKKFLVEVAEACDAAYWQGIGKEPQPLFTDIQKDILLGKVSPEEIFSSFANSRLAQSLAGFFATQEAVFNIATDLSKDPKDVLENLVSDRPDEWILNRCARFAHATWLTSAAFRQKLSKSNVMTFDQLPDEEKMKDHVQVQTVAKVLLKYLNL